MKNIYRNNQNKCITMGPKILDETVKNIYCKWSENSEKITRHQGRPEVNWPIIKNWKNNWKIIFRLKRRGTTNIPEINYTDDATSSKLCNIMSHNQGTNYITWQL